MNTLSSTFYTRCNFKNMLALFMLFIDISNIMPLCFTGILNKKVQGTSVYTFNSV